MGKKKARPRKEREKNAPAPTNAPDAPSDDLDPEDVPLSMDYSFLKSIELTLDVDEYFARPITSKEEITKLKDNMQKDAERVKLLMHKMEGYFKDKVEQIGINRKEFEITIPIEYLGMKFTTMLSMHPSWIFIKCKVFNLDDAIESARAELFKRVLVANFELNAVFYSVDPDERAIWVENDIAVPGLDLESFDIKFNAIIFGIKYFVDQIALPLDQHVKSTFSSKASSMYT